MQGLPTNKYQAVHKLIHSYKDTFIKPTQATPDARLTTTKMNTPNTYMQRASARMVVQTQDPLPRTSSTQTAVVQMLWPQCRGHSDIDLKKC